MLDLGKYKAALQVSMLNCYVTLLMALHIMYDLYSKILHFTDILRLK